LIGSAATAARSFPTAGDAASADLDVAATSAHFDPMTDIHRYGGAAALAASADQRPWLAAMLTGARGRCPACGRAPLLHRYLKVADRCSACGEEMHHHRADDAPPYFVMLILGHLMVPLLLTVEMAFAPPLWVHLAIWPVLTVGLALLLLPVVKGAIIGLQWALRMHGFGGPGSDHNPAEPTLADFSEP
jgi:uncharacterized protein (DUF983 family)